MADFGALRDFALERCLWAHGFDVVVTRPAPADEPIECRAMWLTQTTDDTPLGGDYTRREARHVMVFDRADVPEAPIGTRIVAPERMGSTELLTWEVDGHQETQADQHRVVLRQVWGEE